MTQQELLNLIHQTVCDTFSFYKTETIDTFNALLIASQPSTPEQSKALQAALFNYTMATSETILLDGILNGVATAQSPQIKISL